MMFDDERTANALGVLDEISDRLQVIVFTYYEHVVELARSTLAAGRVHFHELSAYMRLVCVTTVTAADGQARSRVRRCAVEPSPFGSLEREPLRSPRLLGV